MAQLLATPPTNRFGVAHPDSRKRKHNGVMGADASVQIFQQSLYAAGYSAAMTDCQACRNQLAAQVASLQHDYAVLRAKSMAAQAARAAAEASESVCRAEAAKAAKQVAKQVAEATESKSKGELELRRKLRVMRVRTEAESQMRAMRG